MLFKKRFWPGIRDGSVTRTLRRWKSPRVLAGKRYRTAAGMIEVTAVNHVAADQITGEDVRASGYDSKDELLADLPSGPTGSLYRIDFHLVGEADPRDTLASETGLDDQGAAEITRRLQRLDRASKHGPWTGATLHAVAAHPGERAATLAVSLGRERDPLKLDIRKLKNLGLTLSLEVGYTLSPRGEAYLAFLDENPRRQPSATDVKDSDSA